MEGDDIMHHYNGPGGMRHGFMPYSMMGYSWIWFIGIGLLVILIVIGILLLMKRSQQSTNNKYGNKGEDRALTILKERFAKGEITEEQYYAKRKVLEEEDMNT